MNGLAQIVELNPAVVAAAPEAFELVTQFGVPDQRRQVVDGHCHADMVHRCVCQGLDGAIRA